MELVWCRLGYGEILEKNYRILPQLCLEVKFKFRNISLKRFFDLGPFDLVKMDFNCG